MKEIVSLLIEKGADINITNSEYRTPLHQVCVDRNLEIVRHLLDNGANINAKDSDGMTPLFYCLRRDSEFVMLISAPFSINKDTISFIWTVFPLFAQNRLT
jgi:ankyrin repeat protein